jgi:protein involved in polysaccharide export with SLBB domain
MSSFCEQRRQNDLQQNRPFGTDQNASGFQNGRPGQPVTYSDNGSLSPSNRSQLGVPNPPEVLTEFQKFAAATTRQVLPIFGVDLFQNVPSTFAPLDRAPIPPNYVMGPDDEVRVSVWGQVNFNANLKVSRGGDIFLPQIGAVHIAGLQFSDVEQKIRVAVGQIYRNFDLRVDLGQIRAIQVYVTGVARRPGVYTISSLSSLVDALFESGGPSIQGSMRRIELRRAGKTISQFDLYDLLVRGESLNDAKLLSGDVIFIPPVGQQVAILGSVRRAAIYELRPGDTVADVIKEAGGTSAIASEARVSLERIVDHESRNSIEIALDSAGQATKMEGGDILRVFSIIPQYRKTVTIRGNVANPGRFAWHEGMRLNDVIPDRESLITRDYWWRRTQLGLPALEYKPEAALINMHQPRTVVDLQNDPRLSAQGRGDLLGAGLPGTSNSDASDRSGTTDRSGAFDRSGIIDRTGAFDPNELPPPPIDPNNQQTADNMQSNSGQSTQRSSSERGSQSALVEAAPANSQGKPEFAPLTSVHLSAPEIDWSYAVIERMNPDTLKTTLVPFDLGKLVLDHDSSQNLELKSGDVISIFSQADIHVPMMEQTKLVRLEGEFVHAGTYSALPGETLRSLAQRAGGLTANSYLYGSEFTRESTRVLQQRRVDESIQSLTLQMQRGNLALASSPVSSAQDLAGMSSSQASERELIAQLKQIRATGRIVLEFNPESRGADILPDIPLENGDSFIVPSLPSTVNVVGAVYNQNSFLYRAPAKTGTYLRLAGGPNTYADQRAMFVVRANGEVVSRKSVGGPWRDEFNRLRMNPGDTLVVPEKSMRPSALRTVLDISQIMSQFAFGAAAINVLR